MAVAISKAGPYYTSGSISFSSLRQNFREQQPDGSFPGDSASISASQLLRSETKTTTNPIIPDCTENRTSGPLGFGITTGNNLSISQFRNSIKYYYLTQSGTNDNVATPSSPGFNIDAQSWNSNLNRNIHKILYVNGTIGSVRTNQPASGLSTETHNLVIDISGSILGAGGTGGSGISITGENGGTALSINPGASGSNVVIKINTGAKIYGGGGGGEKGKTGPQGLKGTCLTYGSYTTGANCGGCPGCPDGYYAVSYNVAGGNNCNCGGKGGCRDKTCSTNCQIDIYYEVPGAAGGEGGSGGNGQGYLQARTTGATGLDGAAGGCPSYGGDGIKGENGGNGGFYGDAGKPTENTGQPGSAGRAISGQKYTLQGFFPIDPNNNVTIAGEYVL